MPRACFPGHLLAEALSRSDTAPLFWGVLLIVAYLFYRVTWALRRHLQRGPLAWWLVIPFLILLAWSLATWLWDMLSQIDRLPHP